MNHFCVTLFLVVDVLFQYGIKQRGKIVRTDSLIFQILYTSEKTHFFLNDMHLNAIQLR